MPLQQQLTFTRCSRRVTAVLPSPLLHDLAVIALPNPNCHLAHQDSVLAFDHRKISTRRDCGSIGSTIGNPSSDCHCRGKTTSELVPHSHWCHHQHPNTCLHLREGLAIVRYQTNPTNQSHAKVMRPGATSEDNKLTWCPVTQNPTV